MDEQQQQPPILVGLPSTYVPKEPAPRLTRQQLQDRLATEVAALLGPQWSTQTHLPPFVEITQSEDEQDRARRHAHRWEWLRVPFRTLRDRKGHGLILVFDRYTSLDDDPDTHPEYGYYFAGNIEIGLELWKFEETMPSDWEGKPVPAHRYVQQNWLWLDRELPGIKASINVSAYKSAKQIAEHITRRLLRTYLTRDSDRAIKAWRISKQKEGRETAAHRKRVEVAAADVQQRLGRIGFQSCEDHRGRHVNEFKREGFPATLSINGGWVNFDRLSVPWPLALEIIALVQKRGQ